MPEMHLKHRLCMVNWYLLTVLAGHLLKTMKKYKNSKKQEIYDIVIASNWIKLAFNLTWLMEILSICLKKEVLIKYWVKNLKYDRYQRDLASMVYKYSDKKSSTTSAWSESLALRNKFAGGADKSENMLNQELAEELHKPIIRKLGNKKYTHLL